MARDVRLGNHEEAGSVDAILEIPSEIWNLRGILGYLWGI